LYAVDPDSLCLILDHETGRKGRLGSRKQLAWADELYQKKKDEPLGISFSLNPMDCQ